MTTAAARPKPRARCLPRPPPCTARAAISDPETASPALTLCQPPRQPSPRASLVESQEAQNAANNLTADAPWQYPVEARFPPPRAARERFEDAWCLAYQMYDSALILCFWLSYAFDTVAAGGVLREPDGVWHALLRLRSSRFSQGPPRVLPGCLKHSLTLAFP